MEDWQEISTAPKDKTWLLIARGDQMAVGWFNTERSRWTIGCLVYFDKPTHWMPLPKPPAL